MTLDEAIKHAEEVSEEKEQEKERYNNGFNNTCSDYILYERTCKCAEEHRQLAEWLKELKRLKEQKPCEDAGEISDGYHTFNQLYHQRAILFATIVNQNKDKAWKSYKHSDGKYCFDRNGEWFIVGVDTPEGSYTYHYSKEYWDYFECKELDCGKEWDGHTEEDVTRLLSLKKEPCEMSAEEYRQRMIQAFHNADTDELIAVCVLPTEKEFEHLEWLLKNHYKKEPCGKDINVTATDAISRQAVLDKAIYTETEEGWSGWTVDVKDIESLPSVTPQPKTGQWIAQDIHNCHTNFKCSECDYIHSFMHLYGEPTADYTYCPNCGCKMKGSED